MKKLYLLFIIFLLALPSGAYGEIKVVATLPTLGSIAKAVCGDLCDVKTLATINEDPHFVDPRPDFVLKLNRADVLFYNGMEYEIGWLPSLQKSSRNASVMSDAKSAVDASLFVEHLEVPEGKVERSAGDVHAAGNPHYLYSAPNVVKIAKAFSERMSELYPDNAKKFEENTKSFEKKVDTVIKENEKRFASLASRKIVSYHASLPYLAAWLKLEIVTTVEPKPGIAPNPSHVAKVVSLMKKNNIKAILQESYQPTSASEKIAEIAEAKVVRFATGPKDNEAFDVYLKKMCDAIFDAMR